MPRVRSPTSVPATDWNSVATGPGFTTSTRTPEPRLSSASASERAMTNALVAA
jgi:hypothetical protein